MHIVAEIGRVANRAPLAHAEERPPMLPQAQADPGPIASHLAALSAAAASHWPAAANPIRRATALVAAGAVYYRGQLNQHDQYEIEGYYCSVYGRSCTCGEDAPLDPRAGRLCSHRLAAMLLIRCSPAVAQHLAGLLARFAQSREGRTLILHARGTVPGPGNPAIYTLHAYTTTGPAGSRAYQRLEGSAVALSAGDLGDLIHGAGLRLASRQPQTWPYIDFVCERRAKGA